MLTATDRQLLHACRAKRYALAKQQVDHKKVTRAPWPPEGCRDAQDAERNGAAVITALHIVEAEIRGVKPAHAETLWTVRMRTQQFRQQREQFDAWLLA